MGKGPGCNRVKISLADYQERVGDEVMTVDGNIYSFTQGSHNISTCDEIVFADEDQLVIPNGSNVTLYGGINIRGNSPELTNFRRISVSGGFIVENGSDIDIDEINGLYNDEGIAFNVGIYIDKGGSFESKKGSKIEIRKIINSTGILINTTEEIVFNGGIFDFPYVKNGVAIYGVNIENATTFDIKVTINDETVINIQEIIADEEKDAFGIVVFGELVLNLASITISSVIGGGILTFKFIQNGGKIHFNELLGNGISSLGVTELNDGLIQIDNVEGTQSFGLVVGDFPAAIPNPDSSLKQNGGKIKILNINRGIGIATVGTTNNNFSIDQTGGEIIIEKVVGDNNPSEAEPKGLALALSDTNISQSKDGIIRINSIDNGGIGLYIQFKDLFSVERPTAILNNLFINSTDNSGIGIWLSKNDDNVYPEFINNGNVDVSKTAIGYTIDQETELFDTPDFETYFKGDGTYTYTKP